MTYLTIESLTRDVRTEEVEIDGIGTARICELSRSKRMAFDQWLRPGGYICPDRDSVKDLKLVVMCLVDEKGDLLFDLDDAGFEVFVDDLADKAAGPWGDLAYEVLRVNGFIKDEDLAEDPLMEK